MYFKFYAIQRKYHHWLESFQKLHEIRLILTLSASFFQLMACYFKILCDFDLRSYFNIRQNNYRLSLHFGLLTLSHHYLVIVAYYFVHIYMNKIWHTYLYNNTSKWNKDFFLNCQLLFTICYYSKISYG